MTDWHTLKKEETLELLNSSENGLSEEEAKKRLKKYGQNSSKEISRAKPFFIFLEQFKSVFILILLFAAVFSLFIEHYIDFYVIMAIVFINSAIGFAQQYKAEKAISEMKKMLVPKARVFRDWQLIELDSRELVPGDIVQLNEGDRVVADCRIIHETELRTNEAVLTGESFPQKKTSSPMKLETELADREDMLYMGTTIVTGNCKAIVVTTGMSTEFGKIAKFVQTIKEEQTPLQKKLDDFSKKVAIGVLILAFITTLLGIFRGEEAHHMILTGISLAVSVIPEGIPAVIAITLALAIKRMEKSNSLIRKLPAAETLGRTTVICADKTGTMTEEKMTVTKIYCSHNYITAKNGLFYDENNKKISANSFSIKNLLKIGIMCNNARIEKDKNGKIMNILGDPTEKALIVSADKAGIFKKHETEKEARVIEYSFSSKRKMMSIIRKGDKLVSYVKGSPEIILKKSTHEFIDGRVIYLTSKRKNEIMRIYHNMASQGLRVLGFAFKEIIGKVNQEVAENSLVFSGFQGIMDPPRKEVPLAIQECLSAGIKVKMITGDSMLTAKAISKMIGLDGEEASIEESELVKLSEKEFSDTVRAKNVFARVTPETKLRIIKELKEQGEIVAVTGDGMNDVLALKEAHIGVAMGIRGSDVARDVSDIILLDDNFASVVKAVKEGRRVYDNMKKSIQAHISANADELFVVLFALAFALPLPMLPLAILWMNLITDSLPSLVLGIEPAEKDIMKRKPVNPKETILAKIWLFIIAAGIITFAIAMAFFLMFHNQDLDKARTMVITSAVICEMFIVLASRTEKNIWNIDFWGNKFLNFSIALAIILQLIAVYTPLSSVFGFKALSFLELILIFALSSLTLVFLEGFKFFQREKQ